MRLKLGSFTANMWALGFLKNCRRTMKPLVADMKALEGDIKRQTQALFDERVDSLPDKKGRTIIAMCSLVLASYRSLKERLDDPTLAVDTVRATFEQTYAKPMQWAYRLWLRTVRDPVAKLQRMSMASYGRRMYGKSMEFADENSDEGADMLVTKCAFHQFFIDHGEPSLTLLICAWDRNWMDLIDHSARPVILFYKQPMALEPLLRGSFPNPGDEDRVRQIIVDDVGKDELGLGAHRKDGDVHFAYPIAVLGSSKK